MTIKNSSNNNMSFSFDISSFLGFDGGWWRANQEVSLTYITDLPWNKYTFEIPISR